MQNVNLTQEELQSCFLTYKLNSGLGRRRIEYYNTAITKFCIYLKEKGIDPERSCVSNGAGTELRITKKLLIEYQYYLYTKKYLTELVVKRKLHALTAYYTYLYHNNLITANPFTGIRIISLPREENLKKITRYYTFPVLINRWIKELKRTGISYITIRNKTRDINIFIEYINGKSIYKIDEQDIHNYMQYLIQSGYSGVICVQRVMHLLQFYKYLKRTLLINKNPAEEIDLTKYRQTIPEREKQDPKPAVKTSWDIEIEQFSSYFMSLGRSINTLKLYLTSLKVFKQYLNTKDITGFSCITRPDIIGFQQYLINTEDYNGRPYSNTLIYSRMIAVRSFFRYLLITEKIKCDPSSGIQLIKKSAGLGYNCLTEKDAERILNQPDTTEPLGIRDRAIMEVLYSTGIRNSELRELKVKDIDLDNGLVRIDNPKGGKEYQRVIAIGRIACEYVKKYINEVRHDYAGNGTEYLFITKTGRPLLKSQLNDLIKKYVFRSGIRKRATSHSWRVTCATLMLKNNADIRYIQEQLGHRSIITTQRYTRLVPKDLKRVHTLCHPRERI